MHCLQQNYISLLFRVAYTVNKFLSAAGDLADFFVCSYILDEHIFYNFTYAFLKSCFVIRLIAFTQFHKFHLQLPVVFYFKYTFMDNNGLSYRYYTHSSSAFQQSNGYRRYHWHKHLNVCRALQGRSP